jgi:transcriptional antiterminator Rof (Rho-off)
MSKPYRPISCDFHDELCLLAMRRRACEIVYRDSAGQEMKAEDRIEDVYTAGKEEFLRLTGGKIIRLDRLVKVDGKSLPTPTD